MAELVADRMTAGGKCRDLAAGRVFGKFVGVFPVGDLGSFEAQLFVAENVELDALRPFYFFHASVGVKRVRAGDGDAGIAGGGLAGGEVDDDGGLAIGFGDGDIAAGDDGDGVRSGRVLGGGEGYKNRDCED